MNNDLMMGFEDTSGGDLDAIEIGDSARAFRNEVRDWLKVNAPSKLQGLTPADHTLVREQGETGRAIKDWTQKLYEAGYMCVAWPKEYGGRGLGALEVYILNDEFRRADVPRMTRGLSEWLAGPAIIHHGTDEQKAYFLPRIVDGTDVYCQGFSEPNAGSDLASLRTKGVVQGDEIVVTGQKVWTSDYTGSNMIFCLCRTDPSALRHRGVSFVLLSTENNNVEFRPIVSATGGSYYAETFLIEARAPLFNIIGGMNNGWAVAMTTLGSERGGSATIQQAHYLRSAHEFRALVSEAKARGRLNDPHVRDQLSSAYSNIEIMRMSSFLLLNALATGQELSKGAESTFRIRWTEHARRMGEIALDIVGPDALITGEEYDLSRWQYEFLEGRTHTVGSGTSEIQRNIIAERVLGMPREPRA